MIEIAEGVLLVPGKPRFGINVYLIDDVLIDSGTPSAYKRIFLGLGERTPTSHVVTHAHSDHFGSSARVCQRYDIPLACGAADAEAIETGRTETSDSLVSRRVLSRMPPPSGVPVARRLSEGDRIGRLEVVDVPGHSRGHIALWDEGSKMLVLGDVLFNLKLPTLRPGLCQPPTILTLDPALNRKSARKLGLLKPELVLFGLGPPLRDPDAFGSFVESLPD
ncbi:MAG: MBL fold metallo-hydrolase [Actinomycetota bacterium]